MQPGHQRAIHSVFMLSTQEKCYWREIHNDTIVPCVYRFIYAQSLSEGRTVLKELAGIDLSTKAVERTAEAIGEGIEQIEQRQIKAVLAGNVKFLGDGKAEIPTMYVLMDGTGVPVVGRETEGRMGKTADGKARTREAKLGCVFTQTGR